SLTSSQRSIFSNNNGTSSHAQSRHLSYQSTRSSTPSLTHMEDYPSSPLVAPVTPLTPTSPGTFPTQTKGGVSVFISLNHAPTLFAHPGKGCELGGNIVLESDRVIKIKSIELRFIEVEYFEFGVPRITPIPFVVWPLKYTMQLQPGSHHIPFTFLLPTSLHTTAFTKFNYSQYELKAVIKAKGFSKEIEGVRELEFFPVPRLYLTVPGKSPFATTHNLGKLDITVSLPSPFVAASSSFTVDMAFSPSTPYYYLAKIEGKFLEMIEYTRNDGTVMYKDPDRTVCTISNIAPQWRDPIPLVDNVNVSFAVDLPILMSTPPKRAFATNTSPSVMPDPVITPYILYDVNNSHLTIKHVLFYDIELWDIRGAPHHVNNSVQIRILPPLPADMAPKN
ncbi:hypothetical protein EC988_004584, partial [Linderina pennispora]